MDDLSLGAIVVPAMSNGAAASSEAVKAWPEVERPASAFVEALASSSQAYCSRPSRYQPPGPTWVIDAPTNGASNDRLPAEPTFDEASAVARP